MSKMKAGLLACLAGLACAAQTMPYPVGWVYTTSVLDPDNLVFLAAGVADTGGESGHTASAVLKLTSPDGRVSYGTGAWGYSSFASGALSFCDTSYQCHDGRFRASSEGTQEYCPVTSTYLAAGMSYADQQQAPFVVAYEARWSPPSVARRNGKSDFILEIVKTGNCPGGYVGGSIAVFHTEGMLYSLDPGMEAPNGATFSGNSAQIRWRAETSHENPTAGSLRAHGTVIQAPCTVLQGQSSKAATLAVQ